MPRVDNEQFYASSIKRYGITAQGVHWRSSHHQHIRFKQIASLILAGNGSVRIADAGCGFGDLYDFLQPLLKERLEYIGIDIYEVMVNIAGKRTGCDIHWIDVLNDPLPKADYYVCSGALNTLTRQESGHFIRRCFEASAKGFIFNFLEGEDVSETYNYLRSDEVERLAGELGAVCVFRRGYLSDDATAAFYKH